MHSIRPRRKQDDEFFDSGNDLCQKSSSSDMILFFTHMMEAAVDDDEQEQNEENNLRLYDCCVPHCRERFDSIAAQEEHYEKNHIHQCRECNCIFSHEHLLDLHLQETHDAYYQSLLQYNKATYSCLVQTCPETFDTPQQRFHHLQTVHGYPKWFRFPTLQQHNNRHDDEEDYLKHNKQRRRPLLKQQQKQHWKKNNHDLQTSRGQETMSIEPASYVETDIVDLEKRRRRNARRKERNKDIPCRYYNSPRGCWRGDKCMFLHEIRSDEEEEDDDDNAEEDEEENVDMSEHENDDECILANENRLGDEMIRNENNTDRMQVDEILVNQMKKSMKITVPAKISFGRRRA
mmetsp:Transcript_8605/g.16255  ORF Transcript_8605/g.16255 Transcript_8605/m.16255 type:complete len:347 (-) Transcript_8605:297-1337(-)